MPFLNIKYGLVIYEDESPTNPQIRIPDIARNIEQISVAYDKSDRLSIAPNEIKDIATTARAVLWDNTTELKFDNYISQAEAIRLTYTGTGTAPSFRTNRQIGGNADTEVTITRVSPYVARIQNTAGTAWDLSAVQPNDFLRIEKTDDAFTSPFSTTNQGKELLVQAVGSDYIDFIDNGNSSLDAGIALGADYGKALKVVSQGPVKKGDTIQIAGSGVNPSNHGAFEVVDVSDDYIEFNNPLAVEQTVVIGSNSFVVYEYLIGFLHLRSSGAIEVKFGEQTEWVSIENLGSETLFIGSVSTHKIQAKNSGLKTITASVQYAMVFR